VFEQCGLQYWDGHCHATTQHNDSCPQYLLQIISFSLA
jgi:hypothetical protein